MAAMIVEYRNEEDFLEGQIGDFRRRELLQKRCSVFRRSWELEQVVNSKGEAPVRSFSTSCEQEASFISWLLETGKCGSEIRGSSAKFLEDRKLSLAPPSSVSSGGCRVTQEITKGTVSDETAKPLKSCLVLRSRSLDERSQASLHVQLVQSRSVGSDNDESDEELQSVDGSFFDKPTSPSAQKSVHFPEDEYLVEVRNFVPSRDSLNNLANFDGQPGRPKCLDHASGLMLASRSPPELQLCFSPPSEKDFETRVAEQCVCMEKAGQRLRTLTVVVGVRNLSYEKEVTVRYSLDSWKTFSDLAAQYIPNSTDGFKDRFMFNLTLPKQFKEMEFAIRYRVDGNEFWDSNSNQNYRVVDAFQSVN